ncbi:MAG: hypothetical protein RLZZ142_1403 [Verrucomicrobiota bacterium]
MLPSLRSHAFGPLLLSLLAAAPATPAAAAPEDGTHRQAAIIQPTREALTLVSFVVAPDGLLTAAIVDRNHHTAALQVFSPDRKLLREIPIPVIPSALARFGDQGYLVAGSGKLLHLSSEGKILQEVKILDLLGVSEEQLRAQALEIAKKDAEDRRNRATRAIADLEESIKKMESLPAPTERQKARLASSQKMLERQRKDLQQERSPESTVQYLVANRTNSPSLSGEGDSVFLTLSKFRGYEVLKLDRNLANPKPILGDLRGCCGQMDVITSGGRIFTAENTKFEVGVYDLEGKKLASFGQRFKDGNQGFGSCCNPMNVLRYENGDILTAESSIGTLKRFNAEGKLLGVIGRARIGEGCKHVAIGHDPQRDRYYVQYQDRNHICVLLPNAEAAPLVAEQDKQIAAAEKTMESFAGKWTLVRRPGPKTWDELRNSSEGIRYDDYIAFKVNINQSFDIRPDHRIAAQLRIANEEEGRPEREVFMRWVVTGTEGDAAKVEFESADGIVAFAGTLRRKSESALELTVSQQTWTLNKE